MDDVLIGGCALDALEDQRATTDIDLLLEPTREQGEKAQRALLSLPDGVARPRSRLVRRSRNDPRRRRLRVDLTFSAGGESLQTLARHVVVVDLDGVPVRTLDVDGLLKTKQTARDKDAVDRLVPERARDPWRQR